MANAHASEFSPHPIAGVGGIRIPEGQFEETAHLEGENGSPLQDADTHPAMQTG
ncbi:MAG: hypothetical protein WCA37_12430 [Terracidiphilus sp.]